jgi:DNA-binding transcriptional LysR family regulator
MAPPKTQIAGPAKPSAPRGPPRPRPHRVPPPRLYVYFDAIIRHGSIRGAAEALRIASSALNRRLLDLERDLGTLLFDRLQSGVRLTAAGEIFAAHVRRTLSDVAQVGDQIDELEGLTGGHVAIGSAESAATDFLPHALVAFQRANPGMRFTLAVGAPATMLADLLADHVDLILTHQEPGHHDVAVLAAAREIFCALMRPGHPLAGRASVSLAECQDYPVVLAEESLAARALVETALATAALRIQPILVTNMFEVMKHYVRMTDAVSFHFYVSPLADAARSLLVAVPLADPQLAEARLMLAVRRGRTLPPGAAAVRDALRALLELGAGG